MKLITLKAPGTFSAIMVCAKCNREMNAGTRKTPRTKKGVEYCQVLQGLTNYPGVQCDTCPIPPNLDVNF